MVGTWAYIQFMDGPPGRPGGGRPGNRPDQGLPPGVDPIDPGYGIPEGEYPDHELPGDPDSPGHPGHLPSRPGGGGRPGHLPSRPGRPERPDQGLPGGGRPGGGGDAGQLPVWPVGPDQGLPPIAGQPLPPTDPPPGTVWPPITGIPEVPEGKALVLAAIISSTGKRTKHYFVVNIPAPDQGLPGGGEQPDQGLPPDAETPTPPQTQPVPPSAVQSATTRTPRRS
jgi:hypothetical protein